MADARDDLAELIAERARGRDGGLSADVAREMSVLALDHLQALGEADANEVARRLLAGHPTAGASPAAVVARAAVDVLAERGITPD